METEVVKLYKKYPTKHRGKLFHLLLIYTLNLNTWKCSGETDKDAFHQLQGALELLKHEPYNLSTETIERIVNNHEDWIADLMEMDKFDGNI